MKDVNDMHTNKLEENQISNEWKNCLQSVRCMRKKMNCQTMRPSKENHGQKRNYQMTDIWMCAKK